MMQWFKNLKIAVKLILGFSVVIVFAFVLAGVGIYTSLGIDKDYTALLVGPQAGYIALLNAGSGLNDLKAHAAEMGIYLGNSARIEESKGHFDELVVSVDMHIQHYIDGVNATTTLTQEQKDDRILRIEQVLGSLHEYENIIRTDYLDAALAGDEATVMKIISETDQIIEAVSEFIEELTASASNTSDNISNNATEDSRRAVTILVVITALIIAISAFLSAFIAGIVSKPIVRLVDVAKNVAGGNLNVNIDKSSKDEIGMLAESFDTVIRNVSSIVTETGDMYKKHDDGEMSFKMDPDKYEGSYRDMVIGIDKMVESYVDMVKDVFRVLEAFGKGAFETKLVAYKGEKAIANREMQNFRATIQDIVGEINTVALAGAEGKLSTRADASRFEGSWQDIVVGLNNVLDAVVGPIKEAQDVMMSMSEGDFDNSVKGNYKGDFAAIKNAMNQTVTAIASYIKEINEVLETIAKGDLRTGISREYIGQFSSIKISINSILDSLNNTMSEITTASENVLAGSKQISTSAMTLAEGATEQAGSIQELNASIETINSQTHNMANNAKLANDLSGRSTDNAKTGNEEMKTMLTAMEGIKESSANISKIIKVIEDIAFQTNLLALNAAVEAARAGEHGKGFAVVAEEVRSLASRSQDAAKETTSLIEDSIERVNEGTRIANSTAAALNTIVENAGEVSGTVSNIAKATNEQADAIALVSTGIAQISEVVQNNSSTSEESAAAAEELNSQAEVLKQMVAFFKLK